MKFPAIKKNLSKSLIIVLIIAQFGFMGNFLFTPKPAQACVSLLGFSAGSCTILDVPRIIEQVVAGILERVAVNYANKYLTKFVNQVSDKYRIKDFVNYNQYLSDYYVSNLILKNVSDPNLKKAFNIMNSLYVTGQFQAFCSKKGSPNGETLTTEANCTKAGGTWQDPRSALMPQLKLVINQIYKDNGGVDPAKIYYPAANVTDQQYFDTLRAYAANPPSFTEQNLRGQFGAFQSSATTAAQLEVSVGNGLKAGRAIGGWCSNQDDDADWGKTNDGANWDPVTCAAGGGKWNESALDTVRNFITNPTTFIDKNIDQAVGSIFGNNFDASNPYTQIGQALGDWIFSKIDLNSSGGTLSDNGYNPNTYNSANIYDAETLKRQIDLDKDGIPDGQDNSIPANGKITDKVDACYHGGEPDVAPGCVKSSSPEAIANGSAYFTPFCQAADNATDELDLWIQFQEKHKFQIQDGDYGFIFKKSNLAMNSEPASKSEPWYVKLGLVKVAQAKDQTDFEDDGKAEAQIWAQYASNVESKIAALRNTFDELKLTSEFDSGTDAADKDRFILNEYDNYIGLLANRLWSNADTDHIGQFRDGFRTAHDYSVYIRDSIKSIRATINCTTPDPIAVPDPSPAFFSKQPDEKVWPCTSLVNDVPPFMLGLLNATPPTSISDVVDQTNAKFGAATTAAGETTDGTAVLYYPDSQTIGAPEFYVAGPTPSRPVSPTTGQPWDLQVRCGTGSSGGSPTPSPSPSPSPAPSPAPTPAPTPTPPSGPAGTRLSSNASMGPNQSISNGSNVLSYQADGNLVYYRSGNPVWASGTDGTSPGSASMQGDGNFVIYDGSSHPVWASGTGGNSGAYLIITNDGHLLIVSAGGSTIATLN